MPFGTIGRYAGIKVNKWKMSDIQEAKTLL
jgi:hypothetical protein